MKRRFPILLSLLYGYVSLSASENHPIGARSIALSNAFISVSDVWATFHNQSTLSDINHFSAGVFYESRFLIEELSLAAATAAFPVVSGNIGLSFYQFGKGSYKECKAGLAYSKCLSKRLNAAIQLDYFFRHLPENEKTFGFVTVELGFSYKVSKDFTFGLHVFNPVHNGFEPNYNNEKMPVILRFGGNYHYKNSVLAAVEAEKNFDEDLIVKSGVEFYPVPKMALRVGVSGKPVKFSAGLGYTIRKFTCNIAFSYHGNLGYTPSVSFQIAL